MCAAGRRRGRRRRHERGQPGAQAARPRRPVDRRLRAGARDLVLRLRHPLLDQRRGRDGGRAGRPHPGAAPRERHRPADADRGDGDRPRPAPWSAGGAATARARSPFDDLVLRHRQRPHAPARAGHRRRRRATASRPSTTASRCGPRSTAGGAPGRRRRRRLHRAGDRRGLPRSAGSRSRSSTAARPPSAPSTPTSARSWPTRCAAWASSWCCPTASRRSTPAPTAGSGRCVTASGRRAAGRRRRARARGAAGTALAAEAGVPLGTSRRASRSTGGCARQVEGVWAAGRLRGERAPAVRAAGGRRARDAREQAGAGRRHQPRRRVRHLPGRHRHGDHQGLRPRGRRAPGCRARRPRRPASRSSRRSVDSTTRAGYFPGAQPIRVKMIAERRSGRLLGAQIVGREAAAKRIDALAIAIWNEMTRRRGALAWTCRTRRRSRRSGTRC